ncbi:c-type cytochrome [Sphingopyxis sp. OPL5]|uniref:c-type cytochrome n=1 Tax=unclassified Sphingopyxis TaxID=2614943 RepID=UPI0006F36540|nr:MULTISPECIES: c-type cytochrome [unclassified Sphingopyxis]KQZ61205.1 hypothetical protein ASD67_18295 [Sphingopyxis sp. Root1497]OHD04100.1 MAG: hypothetical protein A2885_00295 [Sphingopyxis sp. RIFCSPHIGHO2_01_FULL_65_24]QNO27747.1 c-type cytochrome [Sphingopyxis sp. OPL5]
MKGGAAISVLMLLGACAPAPVETPPADPAAVARGRDAASRLGCGACHAMPGIAWPKGRVGPPLAGFGARPLIAGELPNRAPLLAAFVTDAPAMAPGTAMPAIPMKKAEADDIAAWLLSLDD